MSNLNIKAKPISEEALEREAMYYRKKYNMLDPYLDIIKLYETHVNFEVCARDANLISIDAYAHYNIKEDKIYLLDETYDQATEDIPRDRFTLAHELGHSILHGECYIDQYPTKCKNKIYEEPEWQADQFAACILAPKDMIVKHCKTISDIETTFGVSYSCAKKRYDDILKKS